MVEDKQLEEGCQKLEDVKRAVDRRLKRTLREEKRLKVTSIDDVSKLIQMRKLNVIVEKS